MRDAAMRIIREIGVETGGSNIQFAVNPENGRHGRHRDEPARVAQFSALASKATGFPIAKIAAKLAVGYTLDEIPNDITKKTPACFEPTIDYVVVKIPRLAFEKFPGADPTLSTQMKSVGEAMAIGRTFKEALQKGLRSLEIGRDWPGRRPFAWTPALEAISDTRRVQVIAAKRRCAKLQHRLIKYRGRPADRAGRRRDHTASPVSTPGSSPDPGLILRCKMSCKAYQLDDITPDVAAAGQALRVLRRALASF